MPAVYDRGQLNDQERNPETEPAGASSEAAEPQHENQVGRGYNAHAKPTTSLRQKLFVTHRRRTIAGGGIIGGIIGLALLFSTLSGPFQFVHFAQLLQKFHFTHNQEFSDSRSTRTIVYTILGQSNRTRLGVITNKFADKWEARLINETGLKPVYTKDLNRFAGFEVVDETLASGSLSDFERDGINTRASPNRIVDKKGKNLGKSSRFVDLQGEKFRSRRSVIRAVGRGTGTTKIASAIGSRLLIKRGGIDFHPLKNITRGKLDTIAYNKKVKTESAQRDRQGVDNNVPQQHANDAKDKNGKPQSTAADQQAANNANKLVSDAQVADGLGPDGADALKKIKVGLSKGAGATAVIGALCAVKSFGDSIPDYQYSNTILPMMRIAGRVITSGNQVQSGQDVNLDELGVFSKSFNDPDTKTSWTQARSIQAELGQHQTGPDIPSEAKPSKVGNKPEFFNVVDGIPALGETCGVSSAIFGLPIIKNVAGWISQGGVAVIDQALRRTGHSVGELLNSAVSVVAGRGVDPYAQGADLGNIANYGARLAANDQAISTGGRALTSQEVVALNQQQTQSEKLDNSHLSFAQKYLDAYNANSAVGKLVDSAPASPHQFAMSLLTLPKAFAGSLANIFHFANLKKAYAVQPYDYGFPEYGFSASEQTDSRFDNPSDNAQIVEPRLAELNDKYGDCFSMTINPDTLDLESGKAVAYNKIDPKCNDTSDTDLLRYRFYLADLVTARSLACYEGDNDSCTQLGFESTATPIDNGPPVAGNVQQLAQQILANPKIDTTSGRLVQEDLQAAAKGKVGTSGAPLSSAILRLIATLGQTHSVRITALESGGTGHAANSQHYSGDAVDFDLLDGKLLSGRDPASVIIINAATQVLPKGSRFGQSGCGPHVNLPPGFSEVADTCNHLHVDVPDGTP